MSVLVGSIKSGILETRKRIILWLYMGCMAGRSVRGDSWSSDKTGSRPGNVATQGKYSMNTSSLLCICLVDASLGEAFPTG